MKRYLVEFCDLRTFTFELKAKSPQEAREKALAIYDTPQGRKDHCSDCDFYDPTSMTGSYGDEIGTVEELND